MLLKIEYFLSETQVSDSNIRVWYQAVLNEISQTQNNMTLQF